MNSTEESFKKFGFTKTRYDVFLKEVNGDLSEWAVATPNENEFLVSLGAVAPYVNKFAFRLLNTCSKGRINPQFPSYAGPPILICESRSVPRLNASNDLAILIEDFRSEFGGYSTDDWFRMAADMMPYGPAQSILLPAYYYLKKDKISLLDYLSNIHRTKPANDVKAYFYVLGEMATNLSC